MKKPIGFLGYYSDGILIVSTEDHPLLFANKQQAEEHGAAGVKAVYKVDGRYSPVQTLCPFCKRTIRLEHDVMIRHIPSGDKIISCIGSKLTRKEALEIQKSAG